MKPGDLALVSADAPTSSDGRSPAGLVAPVQRALPDSVMLRGWPMPVPRSSVRILDPISVPELPILLQEDEAPAPVYA